MAISLLLSLVTFTAVAHVVAVVKHGLNGCACPREVPPFLYCDERNQRSSISQSSCVFHDHKEDITRGAWCSFYFPAHAVKRGLFMLPANVSELNSVVRAS